MQIQRTTEEVEITIADGATSSGTVAVGHLVKGSIQCPASVEGNITFDVSNDGANWGTVKDDSNADVSALTPADNRCFKVPIHVFSHKYMRLTSSTSQTGAAVFKAIFSG